MGSFGEQTLKTIRKNFNQLRELEIPCAYVTLEERETYRYKATEENLGGFRCFTLVWHKGKGGDEPVEETRDWDRLLAFLRQCLSGGNS
jgi:hypothetical protein